MVFAMVPNVWAEGGSASASWFTMGNLVVVLACVGGIWALALVIKLLARTCSFCAKFVPAFAGNSVERKGKNKPMVDAIESVIAENKRLLCENQALMEELVDLKQAMKAVRLAESSLPTAVFIADKSAVFHVDCHHVNRTTAAYKKLRLCLDCAAKSGKAK